MSTTIIEAMARALFVQAYASEQEALEEEGKEANTAGPGEDWMAVAPATPPDALEAARVLAEQVQTRNGASLYALLHRAAKADGLDPDELPDGYSTDFGHYLAMQAVGHGVSWFDDHAEFDLVVPHFEYYL